MKIVSVIIVAWLAAVGLSACENTAPPAGLYAPAGWEWYHIGDNATSRSCAQSAANIGPGIDWNVVKGSCWVMIPE